MEALILNGSSRGGGSCFVISHTGSITVVVIGGGVYFGGGPNFIHKKIIG